MNYYVYIMNYFSMPNLIYNQLKTCNNYKRKYKVSSFSVSIVQLIQKWEKIWLAKLIILLPISIRRHIVHENSRSLAEPVLSEK